MNQQINLYQPIFRRQKKVFSAVTMLQIGVFFMVVFISLYLYGQVRMQPLAEQTVKLDHDLSQLKAQLTRLEAGAAGASASKLLDNEVVRLGNELEKGRQIQTLLASQAGNTRGLSVYLESFARQHVQGVWLTGFTIGNGGRVLGLKGRTLSSELVPVYITKLSNEPSMQGTSFNVMELVRPEEPSGPMDFYVSTN